MKCHYINAPGVGMVLIPGCWGAALSGDLAHCTCGDLDPEIVAEYERQQQREAERQRLHERQRKQIFTQHIDYE
jgi:hypothetical protein